MANTTSIPFSRVNPIPLVFDVQKRIQQLRSYLDPNDSWYQPEPQHINIRAAIELYEEGKIDGMKIVWIMHGKMISEEEAFNRTTWAWTEGVRHQYVQKHLYNHGPFGLDNHELRMLVRLIPQLGGDGTVHGIIAMNDTGSNILTLYDEDMVYLGNSQGYASWGGPIWINNANGTMDQHLSISLEAQLVRDDNSPWSGWFPEDALVRPLVPGVPRLSGVGMRRAFYLATGPGNHFLAASATKNGLGSLL